MSTTEATLAANKGSAVRSKGVRAQLAVAREPGVKQLALARAASKLGIATLSYGGMVYLAREGAEDIVVVLVGASGYIAALLFGLQGGTLADVMPKRWALFFGLALQSALCFFVPLKLGAGVWQLIVLLFLMSAISQVTTPAMKSAVRLVTTAAQVAAVSALIALLGSLGAAIGSSFLAPMIVRYSTIQMVMYSAGGVLGIAAIGALKLPSEPSRSKHDRKEEDRLFREAMVTPRRIASWVTSYPAAASMVLVGALVVALFEAINSLLPVYVREVLHTDPTLSVYIFAPAGVGFIIGTILSPQLIRLVGERWVAAMSFFFIAGGAILLGSIHAVAPYVANYSPLRIVEVAGKSLPDSVLATGLIAIPFNFGSTAAGASVQAWLNRYVPLERQGRTFGMQEVIEQALTITALLSLGAIGSLAGTQVVFFVAPIVVITFGVLIIQYSYRASGSDAPELGDSARSLVMGRGFGDPDIESRMGRADDLARQRELEPVKQRKPLPPARHPKTKGEPRGPS